MRARLILMLLPVVPLIAAAAETADPQKAKHDAQVLALVGHNQLHLGRLADAQKNCDAAIQLDPANEVAKDCLDRVASMLVDQDLNSAEGKLRAGDKKGATELASKWAGGWAQPEQSRRAHAILRRARSVYPKEIFDSFVPDWLRQVMVAVTVLAVMMLGLLAIRKLWREWQRGVWYGKLTNITNWKMRPLKELPADGPTGRATAATLDALSRIGLELERPLWQPKLLLLRPTPPANHEPAVIDSFLSADLQEVMIAPPAADLRFQWQLHNIELDQAVQNLQLKAGTSLDLGSVARLLRSIVDWFNEGSPTLSGIAEAKPERSSIHLFASGGRVPAAAVSASTDAAPGIDPLQLSAERAAFKFLFRMQYPDLNDDEIDGFSALRQAAVNFAQYASTVPGTGPDAAARISSLAHIAYNLGFFRASIPRAELPSNWIPRQSLNITDENRQAALLAEGVSYALVGNDTSFNFAINCFRQLQDWPGSPQTLPLRQQAAYNEAIVWRELGSYGQCILLLTTLVGERAPDTVEPGRESTQPAQSAGLPDAIRFPARLARLSAFSKYDRSDWSALPESRIHLLMDDAERLVADLPVVRNQSQSAHDRRLAKYMLIEALRSLGHLEVMRAKTGPFARFYRQERPVGLRDQNPTIEQSRDLKKGVQWMLAAEELAPDCDLYCDLAEAYLLLKEFTEAQGYARHATLARHPDNERAYYLAAESYLLQQTSESRALAVQYARDYRGPVTMEEFKSIRAELGIPDAPPAPTPGKQNAEP